MCLNPVCTQQVGHSRWCTIDVVMLFHAKQCKSTHVAKLFTCGWRCATTRSHKHPTRLSFACCMYVFFLCKLFHVYNSSGICRGVCTFTRLNQPDPAKTFGEIEPNAIRWSRSWEKGIMLNIFRI